MSRSEPADPKRTPRNRKPLSPETFDFLVGKLREGRPTALARSDAYQLAADIDAQSVANAELLGLVRELADNRPRCEADGVCQNPAACVGAYEQEHPVAFACNEHCGHGNEDGWCKSIVADDELLERAKAVKP